MSRPRCAPPSLLPPSARLWRSMRLRRAMASLRSPRPGRRAASLEKPFLSSRTGPCAVQRTKCCTQPNSVAKPMAACGCSTPPGSATVARAPCASAEQCQWHGPKTTKPRRVSLLLHPLSGGSAPLLWHDWSRREHRRTCMQLVRHQRVEVTFPQARLPPPEKQEGILSRAERAHSRLGFAPWLASNARASTAPRPLITVNGGPVVFAALLGMPAA